MPVITDRASRLSKVNTIILNNGTENIEFWDLPNNLDVQVLPDGSDGITTFNANERIDTVAYNILGDVILWDVIAALNGLRELPQDLKPGDRIRIPSRLRVDSKIRA